MASVEFFSKNRRFTLAHPIISARWLKKVGKQEGFELDHLTFIFCSDAYLLRMNKRFLNHDTLTDILTFDLHEKSSELNGEIYISVDRVKENAAKFKIPFDHELHRVMVHGLLHLVGHNDKTAKQKARMRKKEEAYLSLRK